MKLAIFDLDGTLLPIDAGHQWVHFLARVCECDLSESVNRQDQFALEYREGRFDVAAFVDFHMALLARFSRSDLDRFLDRFMHEVVEPRIAPPALALVQQMHDEGYEVVMATGTQGFVSAPIARRFGIRHLLATMPQIDFSGEMTGGHVGGYCFGLHKITRIREFLKQFGTTVDELDALIAYTDSINDLPLLEFVHSASGRVVATNPDPQLKELAQKRGWSIIQLF